MTKLLENTLDESWKLKNISDERLGCLTKSLSPENFYWTLSDLLKTFILYPENLGKTTYIGRPYHFKCLKDCLLQILCGPFLNTLSHIPDVRTIIS